LRVDVSFIAKHETPMFPNGGGTRTRDIGCSVPFCTIFFVTAALRPSEKAASPVIRRPADDDILFQYIIRLLREKVTLVGHEADR
jgi:hypothetical protein